MSIEKIKCLREKTGIGILLAKKMLIRSDGDVNKAIEYIREEGKRIAVQRTAKPTKSSTVGLYSHCNGKIVSMVEICCESDLTATSTFFNEFANNIAMHIAAKECKYISKKDIPKQVIENLSLDELKIFYKESCLLEQDYIRCPEKTIHQVLMEFIYIHKANVEIARFECYRSRRVL